MTALVIIGGGGHAGVVAEAARAGGDEIVGHLAAEPAASPLVGPWLGDERDGMPDLPAGTRFAIGMGHVDTASRARFVRVLERLRDLGAALARIVHPAAFVAPSAMLGEGVFLGPGSIVHTGAVVGPATIVNSGAVVEHDCIVGTGCHLATRAALAGQVHVGDLTLIGAGAVVRQSVRLGSRVIVGAGAAVITDVPDDVAVLGVPARPRGTA